MKSYVVRVVIGGETAPIPPLPALELLESGAATLPADPTKLENLLLHAARWARARGRTPIGLTGGGARN